jgi:hypothetical protein
MPPSNNPNRHSSPHWRDLRHHVVTRDKNICQYCGDVGHQVDYKVPPEHGGSEAPVNMVCCCKPCLNASNDAPYPTFEDKTAFILSKRRAIPYQGQWAVTLPGVGPKPITLMPQHSSLPAKDMRRILTNKDDIT